MKKSDLKKIIKPIVQECINEALTEQGLLSSLISEVVKGLQPIHTQPSMEMHNKHTLFQQEQLQEQKQELEHQKQKQLKEQKRKLLDAAGFGTDIFAGTKPITGGITTENKDISGGKGGALTGVDPHDPGVDIDGLMAASRRNWGKMI